MSDGGIYKGPYGGLLHGSGRQVHPQQVSTTVPLPTNPNPVAPKTDTPATQIRIDLHHFYKRVREGELGSLADVKWADMRLLLNYLERLESTLAAERASRLQADTEQFNAGIEAGAKTVEGNATNDLMNLIACAVRKQAKPSVSPEQAEENK